MSTFPDPLDPVNPDSGPDPFHPDPADRAWAAQLFGATTTDYFVEPEPEPEPDDLDDRARDHEQQALVEVGILPLARGFFGHAA